MDRNGAEFIDIQHQIRQQVVVPDPHDLQNADGDEGRLHHGQDDLEEGLHGVAAVDDRGLLDGARDGLDEAREHEHGKARAEAEVDDGDGPRPVELQGIGGLGQREHDHLERDDHREHAQVVHHAADQAVDTGDIPGGHGRTDEDQGRGQQRDHQAVFDRTVERVVAKGHTLDIVLQAHEGIGRRECEGIEVDGGVRFQGVHQNDEDRVEIRDGDDREDDRQHGMGAAVFLEAVVFHY